MQVRSSCSKNAAAGSGRAAAQRINHAKPRAPVNRKAHRQPRWAAIQGTISGVTNLHRWFVPAYENSRRQRNALSWGTIPPQTVMLAGNTPASRETEKQTRAITKPVSEFADGDVPWRPGSRKPWQWRSQAVCPGRVYQAAHKDSCPAHRLLERRSTRCP